MIAKQMAKTNQNIVGEKFVWNDLGELAFDDHTKKVAGKGHYNRLLNEEFEWDRNVLPPADPLEGPAV